MSPDACIPITFLRLAMATAAVTSHNCKVLNSIGCEIIRIRKRGDKVLALELAWRGELSRQDPTPCDSPHPYSRTETWRQAFGD